MSQDSDLSKILDQIYSSPKPKNQMEESKRSQTAFEIFCRDARPFLLAQDPNMSDSQIHTESVNGWHTLSQKDRQIYEQRAKEDNNEKRQCINCHSTTTPLWRKNSEGQFLCNACGLFLKMHGRNRQAAFRVLEDEENIPSLHETNISSENDFEWTLIEDKNDLSVKGQESEEEKQKRETQELVDFANSITDSASLTNIALANAYLNSAVNFSYKCKDNSDQKDNEDKRQCSNCHTTKTTAWRRNSEDQFLCNACGLYYRLHKVNRPIAFCGIKDTDNIPSLPETKIDEKNEAKVPNDFEWTLFGDKNDLSVKGQESAEEKQKCKTQRLVDFANNLTNAIFSPEISLNSAVDFSYKCKENARQGFEKQLEVTKEKLMGSQVFNVLFFIVFVLMFIFIAWFGVYFDTHVAVKNAQITSLTNELAEQKLLVQQLTEALNEKTAQLSDINTSEPFFNVSSIYSFLNQTWHKLDIGSIYSFIKQADQKFVAKMEEPAHILTHINFFTILFLLSGGAVTFFYLEKMDANMKTMKNKMKKDVEKEVKKEIEQKIEEMKKVSEEIFLGKFE